MSRHRTLVGCACSRRDFLSRGLYGIGLGVGLPVVLNRASAELTAQALRGTRVEKHPERIQVVVEPSLLRRNSTSTPRSLADNGTDRKRRAK